MSIIRLKLTRLTRSFWKRQRNFPKLSPAPEQWEAGQLSRESLGSSTRIWERLQIFLCELAR